MQVVLSEIVKNNYCFYDIHSGCVKGLEGPDTTVCGECIVDAHQQIVDSRKQLSKFAEAA